MTVRDVHWHSATLLKWTQGENGRSYSGVFSLSCFERDRIKEKKNWKFLSSFSLRVSPEQSFSNIHGVYVGLPLNSLMASKELLQHSIWPSVYKCVWSSSEEGNDFVYIWGKEHHQQKKKSRQSADAICTGQFLSTNNTSFYLVLRKRSDWEEKQDPEREDWVAVESCSSHHWHHSGWSNGVRVPSLAATFPALTNPYFTLVGAICYPSGSVPSACLPHKPNNATLLRLLWLWPAAQWKKEELKRRKGKGKVGKRGHSRTQSLPC